MTIRALEMTVTGTAGLLLSNVKYSDPLGEETRIKKFFTDKKGNAKTEGVHRAVRQLDWLYSGYWMQEGKVHLDEAANTVSFDGFSGLYLPGANLQRCLRNAAAKWRLGKDVNRAVNVISNPAIDYAGPQDANELIRSTEPKYSLAAFTKRGVWVCRIMLPTWSAKFLLTIDDELMGLDILRRIANMAGKSEGLGTWRPRYGRFKIDGDITEIDLAAIDSAGV